MIDKIIDWIFMRYGIEVPKLDIVLAMIILAGLVILGVSAMINGVHSGVSSGHAPVPPAMNNLPGPGVGGKI
jgi:hypothetical protein